MKLALAVVVFLFLLVAGVALAGEEIIGRVAVADGGATSNRFPADGGGFAVAAPSKVSIQCDAAAYVCTDAATCSSTTGVYLAANTLFPTSVMRNVRTTIDSPDGGPPITGGLVSVRPASGASLNCSYFTRYGNE